MNRFTEYFTAEEIEFLQSTIPVGFGSSIIRRHQIVNDLLREIRSAEVKELDKETEPYRFDV